jgi:hypothetical protein
VERAIQSQQNHPSENYMPVNTKTIHDAFLAEHEEKHAKHFQYTPILRSIYSSAQEIFTEIIDNDFYSTKSDLKKAEFFILLSAIDEINDSIIVNLESQRFSAAEALSRIALEHSINFIYIVSDPTNDRAMSLLKQHFFGARERAKKWHSYLQNIKSKDGVEIAKARLHHLNITEKMVPGIQKAQAWPDARRRFQATDFEHFYHDLFTPASDSVHTLGEDVFNLLYANNDETEGRSFTFQSMFSEKISFSVYVCASALSFYIESIYQLFRSLNDEPMQERIGELADLTNAITKAMNDDTISDFLTLYPSTVTDSVHPT